MSRAHPYRPMNTEIAATRPQSPIVPTCPAPSLRLQTLVHRVVLGHDPLSIFVLCGDREEFFVGAGLAWSGQPLAAIVKDGQRRRALPLRQVPGQQRMLRL